MVSNISFLLATFLFSLSQEGHRRRQWQATPVLLPRKSHGQRSLVGCSPWGRYESDTTERLHFHFSLSGNGEGNGNPPQCSCLENPRDGRVWWAAVYGVAQSRTRLKWLSSSGSRRDICMHSGALESIYYHNLWYLKAVGLQNTSTVRLVTSLKLTYLLLLLLLLSRFSRVRLCDPAEGSPPGSPIPGILQARTLEWVAISFSNAWKWKVKGKSLSRVRLLATSWTVAWQAPPLMGFSKQEYWSGVPLPSPHISTTFQLIHLFSLCQSHQSY